MASFQATPQDSPDIIASSLLMSLGQAKFLTLLDKMSRMACSMQITDNMDQAEYLRSFLERHDWSRETLSLFADVCERTVYHWLSGRTKCPASIIQSLKDNYDGGSDC